MQSRMSKVLSCVMAVLVPLSMMATSPGAMAVPSGTVSVNGSAMAHPSAVFAGDRIDTADGSLMMTMNGSSVSVAPKSSVLFAPNQMTVAGGGVKIATTSGFAGQVRNLSLRPEGNGKSVYTVAERNGKILIAALEGSLAVNDGRQQMMIAANHAVAIPVQDTDQPKCKKGDKKCEKAVKDCKGDKNCEAQAVAAAGGAAAGAAGAAGGAAAGAAGAGAAAAGATVSTAVAVGVAAAAAAASAAASFGIAKATEPSASGTNP